MKDSDIGLCEFVIIVGGHRTGKTINKKALMRFFNCSECYDGDDSNLKNSKAGRILILTGDEHVKDQRYSGKIKPRMEGLRVSVEKAAALLGADWVVPMKD
jgi:hypothetical protein